MTINDYPCSEDVKRLNPDVFLNGTSPMKKANKITSAVFVDQPSKYRNQRTEYGGRVYDSKKEAEKARDLDLQIKARVITFWLYHVRFPLAEGVDYETDFVTFRLADDESAGYGAPVWKIEVIETKGFRTETWRIKEKLFRARYPNLTLRIE